METKEHRTGERRNFHRHGGDGRAAVPAQTVTIIAIVPKQQWRSANQPEYVVRLDGGGTTDALHSELR